MPLILVINERVESLQAAVSFLDVICDVTWSGSANFRISRERVTVLSRRKNNERIEFSRFRTAKFY
jgi:hypothetical protein